MINVTTNQTQGTAIGLQSAILIYGDKQRAVYASLHQVHINKGQPVIAAGTSLSASTLAKAVQELSPITTTDCYIDDSVIAFRDGLLGWWRRPQMTRVWFHSSTLHEARELPGTARSFSVEVPMPGLIFFVMHGQFFVYAYKGEGRPSRTSEVFTAPLMNVWDSGMICTGSVKLPSSSSSASIPAWEKAFFKSRFTHFNGNKTVKYDGGRIALTRDLVEGKFKAFPEKVLTSEKVKLSDLVTKFSETCAAGASGGIDYV